MLKTETHQEISDRYDVVIVGGGIAGLYCCRELIRKIRQGSLPDIRSILLLEGSDRFGGRIETWSLLRTGDERGAATGFENTLDPCTWNFEQPDPRPVCDDKFKDPYLQSEERSYEYFRAEFGPMRIEPRDQPLLKALLDELGIREQIPGEKESLDDLVPFSSYASEEPMDPRFTLREEEAQQKSPLDLMILALRHILELVDGIESSDTASNGDAGSRTEISGPWQTEAANEQWRNLRNEAFFHRYYWKGELLEWIQNLTEQDFIKIRQQARFRGQPLWNLGFWNVLSDVLSHFAVVKIRDWGSYYHFVHENLNAAEWIIFWLRAIRSTGSLRGIRGGMSRIVWKLLEELHEHRQLAGSPAIHIRKGRKILGLKSRGDTVDVEIEGSGEAISANRVILALPRSPLEEILWNGKKPPERLQEALNAVVPLLLLKCFFIIERPWWEDNRPLNRNAADLPTRELLYVKSKDGTKGLIMVYTDRPAITFWSDYLRADPQEADSKGGAAGKDQMEGPQLEYQETAKTWFLEKTRSEKDGGIVEMKPGSARLWQRFVQFARDYEHHDFTHCRLLACGIRDWGKKPFGAAAHGWRPGVRSWEHIDFLKAFSLDEENAQAKNVHICGEAFSDYQGFVEGSLRSTYEVLSVIEEQSRPERA